MPFNAKSRIGGAYTMLNIKYKQALDVLRQRSIKEPIRHERKLFEQDLMQKGWKIGSVFSRILDTFYGVQTVKIEGKSEIYVLYDSLFDDKAVPAAWFDKTGEHIFPFAGGGVIVFYISDKGYVYGDARDGNAMYHYGYLEDDGLYNTQELHLYKDGEALPAEKICECLRHSF